MKKHLLSKWLFYSGACLLVFLFEAGVLPRLPLASVRPLLLPLSVATIASLEGASAGATFGLFAGILSFLFLPGTHSFSIFLFSLLCFLSAFSPLAPRVWPFLRALFASSLALLLLSAFQILVFLLRYQATLSSLLPLSALQLLLSLACFPPVYAIHRLLFPHNSAKGGTVLTASKRQIRLILGAVLFFFSFWYFLEISCSFRW